MVLGEHCAIRAVEADDVSTLKRMYDPTCPVGCLLDQKREFALFTTDELREALGGGNRSIQAGRFRVVEDLEGVVRGFCALGTGTQEVSTGQYSIMMLDGADFSAPLSRDVGAYLLREAFERMQLNKVVAQCLDSETPLRAYLVAQGFHSDGVQREVLYTLGRWFDLESLTLFRRDTSYAVDPNPQD